MRLKTSVVLIMGQNQREYIRGQTIDEDIIQSNKKEWLGIEEEEPPVVLQRSE